MAGDLKLGVRKQIDRLKKELWTSPARGIAT